MAKTEIQAINAGSMADVAFLLLIFFLVATTINTDIGIPRKLPRKINDVPPVESNDRNVLTVLVNKENKLMVEDNEVRLSELRAIAKEFIVNEDNAANLPQRIDVYIPKLGVMPVTKYHIISLQTDRATNYQTYIAVQNELVGAYNELRNELALERFRKSYNDLDNDQMEAVNKVYPVKISEAPQVNAINN